MAWQYIRIARFGGPEVLELAEQPTIPDPGPAEVRIRAAASGINPGDVKKRQDAFGYGMPYPRVIPHSDGAGTIDRVGDGVPASRVGERVWCYGAQSYRPFGTAAEYVVVPSGQAADLLAARAHRKYSAIASKPRRQPRTRSRSSGVASDAMRIITTSASGWT